MDATGQLAELGERGPRFVGRLLKAEFDRRVGVVAEARPGETQGKGQGHEPLLGAVVEIAFEALALGVAAATIRARDARTSVELRFDRARQPVVLDRQPHGPGDRGDQARLLEEDLRRG